ncbi:hypothetical protein T484DRAFT_1943257 [Baffinella frigidus]|nr:hypothetical protein T484DRAFT_1943257 [Cryptophyta sp. CCMP2293]
MSVVPPSCPLLPPPSLSLLCISRSFSHEHYPRRMLLGKRREELPRLDGTLLCLRVLMSSEGGGVVVGLARWGLGEGRVCFLRMHLRPTHSACKHPVGLAVDSVPYTGWWLRGWTLFCSWQTGLPAGLWPWESATEIIA